MKNAIVYLIVIAGFFFGCSDKQTEITSSDLQRLLSADSIQSISVLNDDCVTIVTKTPDFKGDKFVLKISSSDQFRRKLDAMTKDYIDRNAAQPTYNLSFVRGSSNFWMLGAIKFVLIISILALFLLAAIDILKHRFVSDIEKLIWILVVIFVPILGSIIYLLIGRKQKLKYEK
jgi:hypothetical protein